MDEEKRILDAIGSISLPDDIKKFDVKFSPDSTGMPAVWVNLHVDDDYHPSDAKIDRLREVRNAIADKILTMDLGSLPYVRLVTD